MRTLECMVAVVSACLDVDINKTPDRHGPSNRPHANRRTRAPPYRAAPHNIEAEQALLGAILVNNEALYRVTDFLEPQHFFEPMHPQIYDIARSLIRAGKLATPVTLQDVPAGRPRHRRADPRQYLARLAAEATTVINAVDYGRTVHDLAIRRALIAIGEDMVNVAYDAPVDFAPREQIEEAERRLYELAESGRYGAGSRRSRRRSPPPSTWRRAPISATASCRAWRPGSRTSTARWAGCSRRT